MATKSTSPKAPPEQFKPKPQRSSAQRLTDMEARIEQLESDNETLTYLLAELSEFSRGVFAQLVMAQAAPRIMAEMQRQLGVQMASGLGSFKPPQFPG